MSQKTPTGGERISKIRGGMTQEEFGKLLDSSQGAVSAWERDDKDRSPSAAIYFRLAALARDPDDTVFFLGQAGLQPEAVTSVYQMLLRKGRVKMDDTLLATAENELKQRMGDGKQMEEKGKIVPIKPFGRGRWADQKSLPEELIEAWRVKNKASTYYIIANPPETYGAVGTAVAPRDTIVFDASETSSERLIGLEVLVDSGNTLSIGRVVHTREHPGHRLALALASDGPDRWGPILLDSPHHPMQELTGQILGRVIARFPAAPDEFWIRQAQK